jgi:hypothetical protein
MSFERQAGSARATDDGAVDLEPEIDAAAGPSYLPRLVHAVEGRAAQPQTFDNPLHQWLSTWFGGDLRLALFA